MQDWRTGYAATVHEYEELSRPFYLPCSMEPQKTADDAAAQEHSSIFPAISEMDKEEYERGIRKARNALFIVGALMFVVDMVMLAAQRDALGNDEIMITVVLDVVILAAFIALGIWSKRKPYTALVIGLILFCAIQLLAAIGDPVSLVKGIIVKIFVIAALVSGIRKAKQLQELTRLSSQ